MTDFNDHHWMQTYSGFGFGYPPSAPRSINIIDIARSLSRLPRFLGHSRNFLSVAEHCLVTAQFLEDEGDSERLQLLGLLHDAHEAYIGDLPKPFLDFLRDRYSVDLSAYKNDLQRDILKALDIAPATPAEQARIETVDRQQLAAERRLVMPSSLTWSSDGTEVPDYLIGAYGFLDADLAMRFFERRLDELLSAMRLDAHIAA